MPRPIPDTTPAESLEREVGLALAAARRRVGMTQAQVAEAIGTGQSVVARVEGGKVSSTLDTLQKMAAVTGARVRISIESAE